MKIKPDHRRTKIVLFRMSPAEYAAMEKAASSARSVSDWLREVVLSSTRTGRKDSSRLDKGNQ